MTRNRLFHSALIALFWLAAWQGIAALVGKPIFLPSPIQTLAALARLLPRADFWRTVATSCGRVGAGFALAVAAGLLLGVAGHAWPLVGEFLSPPLRLMRAVPVAAFVILALLWVGAARLTSLVVFVIAMPVVYSGARAGLAQADPALLEMAAVFRLPLWRRARHVYRPALMPHLSSALSVAVGLSWKSGVAAEVIGICQYSIGERLYMSKLYLETADLFAWTAVVVALSFVAEKAIGRLARLVSPSGK